MVRLIDPSNSYSGKHLLKILNSQVQNLIVKKSKSDATYESMTYEIYAVLKSRAIRQKTVLGVNFCRRAVCRETLSCADDEYFFSSHKFLY